MIDTDLDEKRKNRINALSKLGMILGLVTLLIGVMVLVGWKFEISVLKSILPGYVSMKANTAIGFILAGMSLTLLGFNITILSCRLSIFFAAITGVIGLLTLIQYIFNINLGIDQLFFQEPVGTVGTLSPGRMAPATAVNFLLLGAALLIILFRKNIVIAHRLTLLIGIIGLMPLLGYLYKVKEFIGISYYTQMALHTAILFIFCSLSILFITSTEGIMGKVTSDTMGGWILRRMSVYIIIIPIILGWLRITGEQIGYFNSEVGVALMMVAVIIILSSLIWWVAGQLNNIDTIRQQAELKVRENESQIRATLYGIGDGVIATDIKMNITRMNPMAELLTGWKESESLGKPIDEIMMIINEDTRKKVNSPAVEVIRDNKIIGLGNHTLLIARDGTERPIADSGAPIHDENGTVIGVVLVFRDQSSIRAAQYKMREREVFSRSVLDAVGASIAVLDKNGMIIAVNHTWQKFAIDNNDTSDGVATGVGINYLDVIKKTTGEDKENVDEILSGIKDVLNKELQEFSIEYPCHSPDEQRWFMLRATPLGGENGGAVLAHINITEKKAIEESLRENEVHFRTLADSGQALIWTSGLDMKCNYFNQPWLEFTGRTLEQEIGDGWAEGVHPDDLDRCVKIYINSFQRQERFSMDYRIRYNDGSYRWIQDNGTPRYDSQGIFIGFIGHCLDITDRKDFEAEIARSNESQNAMNNQLRLSMENHTITEFFSKTLDLILSLKWLGFNPKGSIFLADDANNILKMVAHKGFSPEIIEKCSTVPYGHCLCGKVVSNQEIQFADCINEDHERLYEGITEHGHYCVPIISGERILGVINLYVKEGHIRNAIEVDFLHAIANTIAGTIEHKRAEEELQRTNILLDSIIENVPNTIFLKDADTLRYIIFNRASEELLGYLKSEMIGKNNDDLFQPQQAAIYNENDRKILESKIVMEFPEMQLITHNNEEKTLHTWLVPIMDSHGEPRYLLGISEDITIQKRIEEERADLENKMRQQQRLESVGQLAAGVAHDFNNLLTGIKGLTQFSHDSIPEGTQTRSDLAEVLLLAKRAEDLTRQLLAFSRLQTLQPVVVDINDLVGNITKMLGRLIGEQIDFKFIPNTNIGTVKADPGQMEQVLVNLAINARDAMPDGGKLTIETFDTYIDEEYARTHAGTIAGSYVMITITDTGSGMDESVLEHIFEPFFTTKGIGKGTGLGLATVYGIIKQHGGNIWVYSEKDKGTSFKIYLPQVDEKIIAQSAVSQQEIISGTETILVVEDEETVRNIARRILELQGYKVLTASLPSEAISILEEYGDKIDLLLTDVVMPEQTGPQLYKYIHEKQPNLRVLFMSGYPDNANIRHKMLDPNAQFIQKPFKYDSLGKKIREVLDEK